MSTYYKMEKSNFIKLIIDKHLNKYIERLSNQIMFQSPLQYVYFFLFIFQFQTYFQPFVIEAYLDHKLLNNSLIDVINYWHDEEGRRHIPPSNDLHDAWYSSKYQSALSAVFDMPQFLVSAWEHMCRSGLVRYLQLSFSVFRNLPRFRTA